MAGRSKNLLKNSCAKDGLDLWEVRCSGGDGFIVEESPAGCEPICNCTKVKENLPCWATSYGSCEKVQLVYLPESGVSAEALDNEKPAITVKDWLSARVDCGCAYKMSARLLSDDKKTELDKWEFSDIRAAGAQWAKAKHVFENYPSGVRYVEFSHGGQDTKYWKGHYGVKMTRSGVFIGKKMDKKNLIKNPCGKSGLDDWEVVANGGDGFCVEVVPAACQPIKDVYPDAEVDSCWATSYGNCEKKQLVDLGFKGYIADLMDKQKPEIKISEWYGARVDAGIKYWLTVRLLNGDKVEIDRKEFKDDKPASGKWYQVTETFKDYPEGARFVEYTHGGRDACTWKGNYGAKITYSSVVIEAEEQESSDDE